MKKIIVFLLCLTMGINLLFAQDIERNIKERLTDYFAKYTATAGQFRFTLQKVSLTSHFCQKQ